MPFCPFFAHVFWHSPYAAKPLVRAELFQSPNVAFTAGPCYVGMFAGSLSLVPLGSLVKVEIRP